MSDKRIESHRDSRKLPKLVHNTEAKSEGENAQIQESWMKCFCTNKEADLFAHTEYIDTCANICLLAIYGDLFNSTENTIFCIYATYFGTSCRSLMNFLPYGYPTSPTLPPHILTRATHNIFRAFSCDMPPVDPGSLRRPRLQRNRSVAKLVRKRALVISVFVRGVI
jgi:hypothetical protein